MASELNLGRVKGTDGAPGTPGKDGKSAYQAAVEKGYTGTEAEFNAALLALKESPFLPLVGGILTGDLKFNGSEELGVVLYGTRADGVRLYYRGSGAAGLNCVSLKIAGMDGMREGTIFNLADPVSDTYAANKRYVDKTIKASVSGAIEGAY